LIQKKTFMRRPNCPTPGSAAPEKLFGPGGPFAPARGARMFDAGALRLMVLGLIAEEPRHGYDIIKALTARFQGSYRPSPGSIYPILTALEQAGFVTVKSWGPKKKFTIAPSGEDYLASQRTELDAIRAQIEAAAAPIQDAGLGDTIVAFRTALYEKMRRATLTDEQVAKLRDLLIKARADIENL
jgi:DNA-binding PadR family transcriptional regulator